MLTPPWIQPFVDSSRTFWSQCLVESKVVSTLVSTPEAKIPAILSKAYPNGADVEMPTRLLIGIIHDVSNLVLSQIMNGQYHKFLQIDAMAVALMNRVSSVSKY